MIQQVIAHLMNARPVGGEEVGAVIEQILTGQATPAQIAGFVVALRMRGENAEQVAAAAMAMRKHALAVKVSRPGPVLDTCGTGGAVVGTFNISTLAALVLSACGVTVAKHGNRAATGKFGSADLLEALGVDLAMTPERVGECIDQVGIGFMFARTHHPAMRFAAPVRAELGVPTVFNLLGPLTNPASASHQLMGVGRPELQPLMADVLARLPIQRAWVVCGSQALDEVSLAGETRVLAVEHGQVSEFALSPADFGLREARIEDLAGGDGAENTATARAILAGDKGPKRDAVVINAAAALCVVGKAQTPDEGARMAEQALDDGRAAQVLQRWVEFAEGA